MTACIRAMGISAFRVLDNREGYQALDERGLVKYQWKYVQELIAQIRGETDMGKETKVWVEPGIVRIGNGSFQVTATVNGKSQYGGRFSTVEAARAKLNEMLGGRKPRAHKRQAVDNAGNGEHHVDRMAVPTPTPDENELIELYRAWRYAKEEYATAWFKTDELRKALDEKAAALRNFLVGRGKVER